MLCLNEENERAKKIQSEMELKVYLHLIALVRELCIEKKTVKRGNLFV